MQKIYVNTDGGSRGNPGVAGCGAVVSSSDGQILKKAFKSLGTTTNNEAEYQGVILGLETVKKFFSGEQLKEIEVIVRMDSELVCRQLTGVYQIKEERLYPYFMKIWNFKVKDIPNLNFVHIPREENKIADELSNEAMDSGEKTQGRLI